jgi:hypothetical protein
MIASCRSTSRCKGEPALHERTTQDVVTCHVCDHRYLIDATLERHSCSKLSCKGGGEEGPGSAAQGARGKQTIQHHDLTELALFVSGRRRPIALGPEFVVLPLDPIPTAEHLHGMDTRDTTTETHVDETYFEELAVELMRLHPGESLTRSDESLKRACLTIASAKSEFSPWPTMDARSPRTLQDTSRSRGVTIFLPLNTQTLRAKPKTASRHNNQCIPPSADQSLWIDSIRRCSHFVLVTSVRVTGRDDADFSFCGSPRRLEIDWTAWGGVQALPAPGTRLEG